MAKINNKSQNEQESVKDRVKSEIEQADIALSKDYCELADAIIAQYEKFSKDMTEATFLYHTNYDFCTKKSAKAFEKIYIENYFYLKELKIPNERYYLSNISSNPKYQNKVKNKVKKLYETIKTYQFRMRELRFSIEKIDKHLDKKIEKESIKREKAKEDVLVA